MPTALIIHRTPSIRVEFTGPDEPDIETAIRSALRQARGNLPGVRFTHWIEMESSPMGYRPTGVSGPIVDDGVPT